MVKPVFTMLRPAPIEQLQEKVYLLNQVEDYLQANHKTQQIH